MEILILFFEYIGSSKLKFDIIKTNRLSKEYSTLLKYLRIR